MLCGIGGATVAQAKANMTIAEARLWSAYRARRGSFNTGLRLELGFAQILSTIHSAYAKNPVSADKFMPHVVGHQEDDEVDDIADLFGLISTVANANKPLTESDDGK